MALALSLVVATLFALVGALCVLLVAIGLPGTWIMIAIAVVIELIDGLWLDEGGGPTFAPWVLVTAVAVALLGEVLEFAASALGAKHGGAGRRGMIGSIVGALVGGIVGTFAIPIPIVGSVLGASLGAGFGAMFGELSAQGGSFRGSLRPAQGAAIGRLLGTIAKLPCAALVWVILVVAAFWP
ncbi:MAG TPA: DUF456 domain-containing protein [Phycisphaerales bacterium]|nr:DUF456 domain-containing protein [Phycisphaerales bacterium]HMP36770.1 DUF456 domain-containing protein [Phycisphaerales bacterium]